MTIRKAAQIGVDEIGAMAEQGVARALKSRAGVAELTAEEIAQVGGGADLSSINIVKFDKVPFWWRWGKPGPIFTHADQGLIDDKLTTIEPDLLQRGPR